MALGIQCPACGSEESHCLDSRPGNNSIRRRRECKGCAQRWRTRERTETVGTVRTQNELGRDLSKLLSVMDEVKSAIARARL
jgi:transcriptional repressor NrdR